MTCKQADGIGVVDVVAQVLVRVDVGKLDLAVTRHTLEDMGVLPFLGAQFVELLHVAFALAVELFIAVRADGADGVALERDLSELFALVEGFLADHGDVLADADAFHLVALGVVESALADGGDGELAGLDISVAVSEDVELSLGADTESATLALVPPL